MIKIEELRIGSIIDFDGMKSIVKEIDNQGVVVFIKETDETEWIDLFQFTPITLTEEILLKCGFEKGIKYFSLNNFDVDFNGWIGFNNMVANVKIQHLHQLQNLYFCLVGKELKIEL